MTCVSALIAASSHSPPMRSVSSFTPTTRSLSALALGWRLGPGIRGLSFLITLDTPPPPPLDKGSAVLLPTFTLLCAELSDKHVPLSAKGSLGFTGVLQGLCFTCPAGLSSGCSEGVHHWGGMVNIAPCRGPAWTVHSPLDRMSQSLKERERRDAISPNIIKYL